MQPMLQSEALPEELLMRIMAYLPFRRVIGCFGSASKAFTHVANLEWFRTYVREVTVVPSSECPTITDGLASAANSRELWILPGVYRDSIRITKNIEISGAGKLGSVVIEAPGWNDALYFAGLGMDGEYVNPKTPDTGELAVVSNLAFRAPNPEQGFIAHIVRGTPRIHHCDIQGGIWISGCKPTLADNTIHGSRSCGVKITDRAAPILVRNSIFQNKFGGVKVKRSNPVLSHNRISMNQSYGMVITTDSSPILIDNVVTDQPDHPKFNPLTGVFGPLPSLARCGFCGSQWALSSASSAPPQGVPVARDSSKEGEAQAEEEEEEVKQSEESNAPATPSSAATATALPSTSTTAAAASSTVVPPENIPSSSAFVNYACWVDPGEISSDDDQLYGDDDMGFEQ